MTLLPRFINKMRGEQIPTLPEPGTETPQHNGLGTQAVSQVNQFLLRLFFCPLPFLLLFYPQCLPFMEWEKRRNVCGLPHRALHISKEKRSTGWGMWPELDPGPRH